MKVRYILRYRSLRSSQAAPTRRWALIEADLPEIGRDEAPALLPNPPDQNHIFHTWAGQFFMRRAEFDLSGPRVLNCGDRGEQAIHDGSVALARSYQARLRGAIVVDGKILLPCREPKWVYRGAVWRLDATAKVGLGLREIVSTAGEPGRSWSPWTGIDIDLPPARVDTAAFQGERRREAMESLSSALKMQP